MTRLGIPRHHFTSVDSTMDIVSRLAAEGAPHGAVVVADEQTAGRGRAGRIWNAPAGSSLLMSVLLRPPVDIDRLTTLPLIAGVAIAEAIEGIADFTTSIALKWPNDIYVGDKKLAGVLMQSSASGAGRRVVNLGIGINVTTEARDLPQTGTSIWLETNVRSTTPEVERAVLTRLQLRYDEWVESGPESGLDAWRKRAMFKGAQVTIVEAGHEVAGVFLDIAASGAMVIETETGVQEVVAGDLVRGPRPAG